MQDKCQIYQCCFSHAKALSVCAAGKSALHWAAAVNNVEAAMVLLKNGANKDMQNNKVSSSCFSLITNNALCYCRHSHYTQIDSIAQIHCHFQNAFG